MASFKPFFTIFTPTYNRADRLPRAFNSLKNQTFNDFEWLIIDDGSKDNTEQLILNFQAEAPEMAIRYFKLPHKGKHFATNKAYDEARGLLFLPLDSDDELSSETSLDIISKKWAELATKKPNTYSGIFAHFVNQSNNIVGVYNGPNDIDEYVHGDIITHPESGFDALPVILTDVIKKEYFPEILDNLNYFNEGIIRARLFLKHKIKMYFFDVPVYRYHTYQFDSVGVNIDLTKARFYEMVFTMNEWIPWLYEKNRLFFVNSAQVLRQEALNWGIAESEVLSLLENEISKKLYSDACKKKWHEHIYRKVRLSKRRREIFIFGCKVLAYIKK